jgi:hypothetical protein
MRSRAGLDGKATMAGIADGVRDDTADGKIADDIPGTDDCHRANDADWRDCVTGCTTTETGITATATIIREIDAGRDTGRTATETLIIATGDLKFTLSPQRLRNSFEKLFHFFAPARPLGGRFEKR